MDLRRAGSGGDRRADDAAGMDLEQLVADPFRLGLFGEFSAGKSSLANLLICSDMLPTSVVSTTRVPTRLRHADELAIEALLEDGAREALSPAAARELDRDDVDAIEIGLPNGLLRYVELIDTPGFSDPYHDSERTLAAAADVHVGLWCTLATQAWRYSEQLIWTGLPEHLRATGLLVVTHRDTLPTQRDQAKVMARLERETGDLFNRIVMLSIPDATRARAADGTITDADLWRSSGGETLIEALLDSLKLAMAERRRALAEPGAAPAANGAEAAAATAGGADEPSGQAAAAGRPAGGPAAGAGGDGDDHGGGGAVAPERPPAGEPSARPPADCPGKTLEQVCNAALTSIQGCQAVAYVDLDAGRLLHFWAGAEPPAEGVERLADFAAALFQGPNVLAIERQFDRARGAGEDGRHYFQEIVIRGDERLCFLLRSRRRQDHASLFVADVRANMGLALVRSRMIMAEIDAIG